MSDTILCPGCHTLLPIEATGCQICMRPRTRQEIMRGYAKLREDTARRRRRPFQIAAAVLVLGVGGKLAVDHRARLRAAAVRAKGAAAKWADDMRNPSRYMQQAAPESAPAADAVPPEPPASAPPGSMASEPQASPSASPSGAPAEPPARSAAPTKPKPLAKDSWRVSGTVFDLATLQPVANAGITFLKDEKAFASAKTDDAGSYSVDLPKGDGWTVSMTAPNRRGGQILDIDPSYKVRDADERRAALEHISDGDLNPAPVEWKRSMSKVRLDLVAVPDYWTDPPR